MTGEFALETRNVVEQLCPFSMREFLRLYSCRKDRFHKLHRELASKTSASHRTEPIFASAAGTKGVNTDRLCREVSQTWFSSGVVLRGGSARRRSTRRAGAEREGREHDGSLFMVEATLKPVQTAGWPSSGRPLAGLAPAPRSADWIRADVGSE